MSSQAQESIYAPFLHKAQVGSMIKIQGIPPADGQRFDVNIMISETFRRAMHMAVYYHEQYAVLSSTGIGGWETEEVVTNLPINYDVEFSLEIECLADGYHIKFNNSWSYVFKHRHDYLSTNLLLIEGNILPTSVVQYHTTD